MFEERADQLVRAIAGFGLSPEEITEPVTVTPTEWNLVFDRVRAERMTGLAVETVTAGWLRLSEEQAADLYTAHRDAMAWCLLIERKLVGLVESFELEGIEYAVLKGASIAHRSYPEPCLRSFCDLDLLVRTEDYEDACALLERLGHRRHRPEPRPGFEVRFGKASVHEHPSDGIEVDLHRTLVLGPFGLWIRPEELLERAGTFTLGGRRIRRLDDTGTLLNVAMHASLGWSTPRLVPLRDVVQVSSVGDVDWDVLDGWARRWQLRAVLRHAFTAASQTIGAPVPEAARDLLAAEVPRREIRALAAYTGQRRDRGGTSLATLRAIPRLRDKVAYAAALAFPERAFLTARTEAGSRPSYRRRLMTPLGWVRSRRDPSVTNSEKEVRTRDRERDPAVHRR